MFWRRKTLKCNNGHELPINAAFESYGAVFQGGVCAICNKLVRGKFLGNAWTKEEEKTIMLPDYDSAEGKAATSECLNKILRRGLSESDIKAAINDLNKKSETLPKKSKPTIIISGLDFSRFIKAGWVITRIP